MTFAQDVNVFVTLAEIAGVFVGFGALIAVTRRGEVAQDLASGLRAVVTIGLIVVVAALVPIAVGRFGLQGHALWLISSLIFLGLMWAVIVASARLPADRRLITRQARGRPLLWAFFWIGLEVPIHLALLVVILGVAPDLDPALYLTALVVNLFQAAFVLAQLVYSSAPADA